MIALGLRIAGGATDTVIDLTVYTAFTGFTPIGTHNFGRQAAGQCFYSGALAFSNASINSRCLHGTVTVEPA
jgi:hypothetical protein